MNLSIITINKNNVFGLQKTMESVFEQTNHDYEWIVIDGGSTDGSKELLEQHRERIHYWISEPDKGIYEAMNKGIEAAGGEHLLFLNSGDRFADASVISDFIGERFSSDIIYGNAIIVDQENQETRRYVSPELVTLSYFWGHSLNHQATFFNRRCFSHLRYNEDNQIASDVELFMTLLYQGFSFEKWDRFIVRFEEGGVSSLVSKDEFGGIVNRLLPQGIKADYDEFLQVRDVDLYQLMQRIVRSPRWVRNLARAVMFPFHMLLK